MGCDFTEKISLLMDGELPPDESERVRRHILACSTCKQTQEDFLRLRRKIKSYDFDTDSLARNQALDRVLYSEKEPLWRMRVSLPVPVFALILIALITSVAWAVFILPTKSESSKGIGGSEEGSSETISAPQNGLDLSRYDGGGRAVIYKARRTDIGR